MTEEREQWKNKYLEEHPKLLEKWREKGLAYTERENGCWGTFVSDGIHDPDKWFNQEIRPLFILKEGFGAWVDWSEIEYFITGRTKKGTIKSKTWRCIEDWAAYIMTNKEWHWTESGLRSEENQRILHGIEKPFIKQIATLNIKKYGGLPYASDADLKKHAENHFEEIYRQIELIKPTIIICGYTGWLLDIVWEKKFGKPIREERNDAWVYSVPNLMPEVRMLDYWHSFLTCRTSNGEHRRILDRFKKEFMQRKSG